MKALIMILFFVGTATSCQNTDSSQKITAQDLELQFKEITEIINSTNCNSANLCSYIAYGSKACGGPQGYLLFSSEIDIERLKNLVEKYTQDEALYNMQNGIASDCSIPAPPENMDCIAGKCVEMD